jgi:hypothetical protein
VSDCGLPAASPQYMPRTSPQVVCGTSFMDSFTASPGLASGNVMERLDWVSGVERRSRRISRSDNMQIALYLARKQRGGAEVMAPAKWLAHVGESAHHTMVVNMSVRFPSVPINCYGPHCGISGYGPKANKLTDFA